MASKEQRDAVIARASKRVRDGRNAYIAQHGDASYDLQRNTLQRDGRVCLGHFGTLADALNITQPLGMDPHDVSLSYSTDDDGVWLTWEK